VPFLTAKVLLRQPTAARCFWTKSARWNRPCRSSCYVSCKPAPFSRLARLIPKVDIRIVCATNRTPQIEVTEGRFREDLYFRLHVLPIHLKPLRERGRDVAELASCFLSTCAHEEARSFCRIDENALDTLLAYHWPGNIRELQNVIRQSVVLHDGEALEAHMLPDHIVNAKGMCSSPATNPAGRLLWQIERDVIEAAISGFAGSIPKAADALGISPSTIYRKRETWAEKSA